MMDAQQSQAANTYPTNFRTPLAVIGAGGSALAGAAVTGIIFGLIVAPVIVAPIVAAAAIVTGIGGGLIGYTAGEKIDYSLAQRNIKSLPPEQVLPMLNTSLFETVGEAQVGCKELSDLVKKQIKEQAKQVYNQHLRGRNPMDVYEEQLLRIPPRPEVNS